MRRSRKERPGPPLVAGPNSLATESAAVEAPRPVQGPAPARVSGQFFEPSGAHEDASDEHLLAHFQRGSQLAFRTLYRRHYQKAWSLALNVTRDEDDASEVVQEAFIRVLRKWTHFEGQAAFYTWLYRIVFNLSIDRLRRPYRNRVPVERIEDQLDDLPQPKLLGIRASDPFEDCATAQLSRSIADAIQRLSDHHRDVIIMRELHGLSYAEIARVMGCSKGTIMSRLFHARQRLQGLLKWLHDERYDLRQCPSDRPLRYALPQARRG